MQKIKSCYGLDFLIPDIYILYFPIPIPSPPPPALLYRTVTLLEVRYGTVHPRYFLEGWLGEKTRVILTFFYFPVSGVSAWNIWHGRAGGHLVVLRMRVWTVLIYFGGY